MQGGVPRYGIASVTRQSGQEQMLLFEMLCISNMKNVLVEVT